MNRQASEKSPGWRRGGSIVLVAGVLALGVAACGGSSGGSSSSVSSNSGNGAAGIQAAKSAVAEALKPLTFKAPGPAFDMGKNRGKTVWFIATTMALPYVATVNKSFIEAAKYAGIKVVTWDGKGSPGEQANGITQAVNAGANAIILQAVDPKLMTAPLQAAAAKGTPVIDANNYEPTDPPINGVYHTGFSAAEQGKLSVDYMLANTPSGNVNALFLTSPLYVFYNEVKKAMDTEIKAVCPNTCKITQHAIDFASIATQVPLTTQSAVRQDPSINWVLPAFFAVAPGAVQGLTQAGQLGKVKVMNFNNVPTDLQALKSGKAGFEADFGDYAPWLGWSEVDQIGRIMAGATPVRGWTNPQRLFTKASPPADPQGNWTGADFVAGYKKLWQGVG